MYLYSIRPLQYDTPGHWSLGMGSLLSQGLNWGPPGHHLGVGYHSVMAHVKERKRREKAALFSLDLLAINFLLDKKC